VRSAVGGEQVESFGSVLGGGAGRGPNGVEPRVSEQFGDDDEVGAAADECGRERVPQEGVVVSSSRPDSSVMVRKTALAPRVVNRPPRRFSSSAGFAWAPR